MTLVSTAPEQTGTNIPLIVSSINSGLKVFEQRKETLILLREKANGLQINSIDDKEGIATVSAIRKELKSARVEIEKEGKKMRDPLTKISKHISAKENELVAIIEPTEKELQKQEAWVESEKKRIEDERIAAEKMRIQQRIDKLSAYGYAVDYDVITSINDETFEKVLENAKVEYEKELARKAEEERLAEIERKRIEDERKELELLRQQQAENEKRLNEEKEKIRIQQEQIEKEKAAIENQRLADERERAHQLELAKAKEEAAEKVRLQAIEDQRIEAEKAEKQRLEHEAEMKRQESLRPDKEKLQIFSASLSEIKLPEVYDDNAKKIVDQIKSMFTSMQSFIDRKISEL